MCGCFCFLQGGVGSANKQSNTLIQGCHRKRRPCPNFQGGESFYKILKPILPKLFLIFSNECQKKAKNWALAAAACGRPYWSCSNV